MRSMIAFLVLGGALLVLASIAIGVMVSIGSGRPSWLLIGVFAFDSIVLLGLFALLARRRNGGASH